MVANEIPDDVISLIDVALFLKRRAKIIVTVFVAVLLGVLAYVFSLPTIYEARVSLSIGHSAFFWDPTTTTTTISPPLIESADEIKFRYKSLVAITAVKNTDIVELATQSENEDRAQQSLSKAVSLVLEDHGTILKNKKAEFIGYLQFLGKNATDSSSVIQLLDKASQSSATRLIDEPRVVGLEYSGKLKKMLAVGVVSAIFMALFVAFLVDVLARTDWSKLRD